MTNYLSGRQRDFKIGVSGSTESITSLDVVGKVGIGTTDAQQYSLYVVGDTNITGFVSATTYYGDGSQLLNISAGGINASGSNGQLQYNNNGSIGGALEFYYDDVTNRVGIATSTPSQDLDIAGDIRVRGAIYDRANGFGLPNYVISSNGDGTWDWVSISAIGAGSIDGLTIREEGTTLIGQAGGVRNLNFYGRNITASVGSSIVTADITVTDSPEFDELKVTGFSTFVNGPVLIGSTVTTGTASQLLQITGGAYISGNTGIGTTNPTSKLHIVGDGYFTGVVTATTFNGSLNGNATTATYATNAGVATYATSSGIASYADVAGIATFATTTAFTNYASNAGLATEATRLQNSRTFEITGDIVASPVSFNGTGNVSLAATIQPNSVALGTDTTGDYVASVSGTVGEITVTGGTGEGSTPVIGISNNVTLPGNVTIGNDLQVNNNLNVNGNITVGGTTGYILVENFRVSDADIILGFTTDTFGNDISNDTTANHGGIAIASTEGTPLVNLNITGIETLPPTYKKIMWFKAGSFAGLGTDAWLSNYAIGIGSTQFPSGTRLAAGNVQFTENDLAVVRNINASGVITATTFNGSLNGNATSATYASNAGIASYADVAGIATYASNAGIASYADVAGIATYATNAGLATEATRLQNARTFEITGDIVASPVSFNGTGNVSLAATIQPNSVALGTDTVGQYASTITGGSGLTATSPNVDDGTAYTINVGAGSGITVNADDVALKNAGSLNNNYLTKWDSGNTQLTNSIVIDNGTNVGIDTSNPTQKLDINGSVRIRQALYDFNNSAGTNNYVLKSTGVGVSWAPQSSLVASFVEITDDTSTNSTHYIHFGNQTSGNDNVNVSSTKLTYNPSTGSLGINTTSPGSTLAVGGTITELYNGTYWNVVSQADIGYNANQIPLNQYLGQLAFLDDYSPNSLRRDGGSIDDVFVNSSGFVGFGTTNATSKLYVVGDGYYTGVVTATTFNGSLNGNATTATYATNAGLATEATRLQNARTFEITGDIVASPVSFNGTGNVSLAATIQPNSVSLGTDTVGNYVGDVTAGSGLTKSSSASEGQTVDLNIGAGSGITVNADDVALKNAGSLTGNRIIKWDSGNTQLINSIVTDNGTNVGIDTPSPTQKLHVQGNARITGALYDSNNDPGTDNYVLKSTGVGVSWAPQSSLVASFVEITDDTSTNSTHYLHFGNLTSGNDNVNVSSSKLTFNPSTGNLGVGTVTATSKLHVVGDGRFTGVVTATTFNGSLNGNASTATALQNARTFDITGDIVASAISFDGTGNVSLAATIQPNSVALGTDTTGNYVADVTAGAGLTKSSSAGEGQTVDLNIGAGSGITVNANDVALKNAGSLTNNYLTKWDSGNTQLINSIINDTGTYVGIGITNPSSILNVGSKTLTTNTDNQIILSGRHTGSEGTFASLYFKNSADAGGSSASIRAIRNFDNFGTELAFYTQVHGGGSGGDGTEAIRVSTTGNFGIGTVSPSQKLHVQGNARITGALYDSNNDSGTSGQVLVSTGTGIDWAAQSTLVASFVEITDDTTTNSTHYLHFGNLNSGSDNVNVSSSKLTFNPSTGNLGVGTVTATSKLHVVGDGYFSGIASATTLKASSSLEVGGSGGVTINNNTITGPSSLYIDPSVVGDNTGAVYIKGDLYVQGTQFQVDSTTINLADKIIGIATTCTSDSLLDGAGIGIGPDSNRKTFLYNYNGGTNPSLKSSENLDIASGKSYYINGTNVLSSTTLGSGVVNSSLTSVGTLTSLNVSGNIVSDGSVSINKDGVGLILQPDTSGQYSLVEFRSRVNSGSDKGFILVQDESASSSGTGTEDLRMTIGVFNDFRQSDAHSDELWLQGGGRQVFNVGSWDSDLDSIIGIPGTGSSYGGPQYDWRINNSIVMKLLNNGNLGIATTDPTQKLHVQGSARITGALYDSNNDAGTNGQVLISTGSGIDWAAQSQLVATNVVITDETASSATHYLHFGDKFSGDDGINVSSTKLAFVPSTGNLGLGSTTPKAKLDVNGTLNVTGVSTFATTVGIGTIIDIVPYDTLNSGTLSFEGSAGQLFSITNNLTSGSIFSVNDVSGIPSIDVDANGTIQFGPYGGNIGVGVTNPTQKLHVQGSARLTGALYDTNNSAGTSNYLLKSTGIGVSWTPQGSGSGLDADLLDGLNSTQFLRSDVSATNSVDLRAPIFYDSDNASYYADFANSTTSIVANGNVLIGSTTETGTSSQKLQVTGGAYVSGNLGIGVTNPSAKLDVVGDVLITTSTTNVVNVTTSTYIWNQKINGGNNWYIGPTNSDFGIGVNRYVFSSSGSSPNSELVLERGSTKLLEVLQSDLFYKTNRVWHAGNDGTGSGLDADLLDGLNSSSANTASTIVARDGSGNFSAGNITATNLSDGTGTYNVNLGSGGSEGRGLVAGYSGGSYGGIGYNVRHTTTSATYISPLSDTASYLLFNSGGFTFRGDADTTGGRTTSLTSLATLNSSGNFAVIGTVQGTRLISTVATGTAPLTVSSTTLVTNLNADLLDGKNTGTSGNTIPLLDGNNTWSGTNTFSAQIQSTRANDAATGQIYLNGATGNRIDFNQNGVAAPTAVGTGGTTRSAGTKIVLYPSDNASIVDFAFGIEGNTLWSSVPSSSQQFKWYAGTTNIATLFGTGEFVLGTTSKTGTASQPLQVTGGAYVSGNLGVGIANPSQKFHVYGSGQQVIKVQDSGNTYGLDIGNSTSESFISTVDNKPISFYTNNVSRLKITSDGNIHNAWNDGSFSGSFYDANYYMGFTFGANDRILYIDNKSNDTRADIVLRTREDAGIPIERLRVRSTGNVGINTTNPLYKLHVVGSFAATTKSFVIDHPTKKGMKLRYGSLESPYHGIRLTGSSTIKNGMSIIELPDYIHNLVKEEGINIHITNIKHGKVIWVEEVNISQNNFVVMTEEKTGEYEFYWDFTAIRKDVEDMIVEF